MEENGNRRERSSTTHELGGITLWNMAPIYEGLDWSSALSTRQYGVLLPSLIAAYRVNTCIEIGIYHAWVSKVVATAFHVLCPGDGVLVSCDISSDFCGLSERAVSKIGRVKHHAINGKSANVDWKAELAKHGRSSAGLCVVDGDHHYDEARIDILKCSEVLKPNGLIVVHDYRPQDEGVWRAVNELRDKFDIIATPNELVRDSGENVSSAILQKKSKAWLRA